MRQLTKAPAPEVLVRHAASWTAEYAEALGSDGATPRRWAHRDVVAALAEETYSKCAYCEAVIADVAYPHVDHIVPKSCRPDLVLAWCNLALACPVCNNAKRDYYDPTAPLIDPYMDQVHEHVGFRGPALVAALGSEKGARSIRRLRLMRAPLLAERMKRIEALHEFLERWASAEGSDKVMFEDVVRAFVAEDQEFGECLRQYAASHSFPV